MNEGDWLPYAVLGGGLGLFLLAYGISVLAVPIVRRMAPRIGLVDRPGHRKIHESTMPKGGGIAVWLGTTLPVLGGLALAWALERSGLPEWVPAAVGRHVPGIVVSAPTVLAIVAGGSVLFVLGLIDDWLGLGPRTKLAAEVAVGVALALVGVRATLFAPAPWFGAALSVGWIVLITNSFNLLDNMDGLSSGVALIAGLLFFWVTVQTGQWFVSSWLLVFAGATAGFLRHNFPPASIFLGDAGSLFVGYQLSVLTIVSTFYTPTYTFFPVALPLLVLAVPLFDTATVVWIRWREGRPIFVGDKKHLSHRLVEMGLSRKEAVLVIYLLTFVAGLGALILYHTDAVGAAILLTQLLTILTLVGLLERGGRRKS